MATETDASRRRGERVHCNDLLIGCLGSRRLSPFGGLIHDIMNTADLIRTFKTLSTCLPKPKRKAEVDKGLHASIGEIFDPITGNGHPSHLDISSEEIITPPSALIDPLP